MQRIFIYLFEMRNCSFVPFQKEPWKRYNLYNALLVFSLKLIRILRSGSKGKYNNNKLMKK